MILENKYIQLMRLHKPIGIFLLLWPTLWALWLAGNGKPSLRLVVIFLVGVILTRSAGCVINDLADRTVDGYVERTQDRPLATGKITPKAALILFISLSLCSFLLVLQLNWLSFNLALIAGSIIVLYPFLKRMTHLPQLGLGVAFAMGVPMAFAAQCDRIPYAAWVVFLASVLWPIIYDTMYAMVDREDDLKVGVKSTAILFGNYDRLILACLQCILVIVFLMIGLVFNLKNYYFFSIMVAGLFFFYQQMLLKTRDKKNYFAAFINNQWVGFIIFLGIALSYAL